MGVIASASKVLFDLTDSGRLFVTITANHLRTQVKETDVSGNASLVPDWKANNLVLTPVVYFDQQKIDLSSSYLSINWSKRVQNAAGADEIAALDSKTEKVSAAQKTLTISDNLLTGATNGMIAYRATITYTVGSVSFTDTAEMEFTLIEDGRDGE